MKGLKSGDPEMVDTFTTFGAGRWFRYVTVVLGLTLLPKASKPDRFTAEGLTPDACHLTIHHRGGKRS